jgi:hypothetical protein
MSGKSAVRCEDLRVVQGWLSEDVDQQDLLCVVRGTISNDGRYDHTHNHHLKQAVLMISTVVCVCELQRDKRHPIPVRGHCFVCLRRNDP